MPVLDERIRHWVAQGYRVTSQTPTSAQLVRPKRFNPLEFLAMPIYILEYAGQREKSVYLSVGPDGTVSEAGNALEKSYTQRVHERPAWQRLLVVLMWLAIALVVLWIAGQVFR